MLEWLIIGGGIHGAHLSHALINRHGVPPGRVRVLDPYPVPLARWDRLSANTGMRVMRSPAIHHIGLDRFALDAFADTFPNARFEGQYRRPAYDLFQAFTHHLISSQRLAELYVQGWARGIERGPGGYTVKAGTGTLTARRVVLAFGRTALAWPGWARRLKGQGARVHHIFADDFDRTHMPPWRQAVVIGGGITAGQLALALAERQPGTVTLLSRHEPRLHAFDSSPCWVGPACRKQLARQRDYAERRRMVLQARNRGSMPHAVFEEMQQATAEGRLQVLTGQVEVAVTAEEGGMQLYTGQGAELTPDVVLLCTGFAKARPGEAWLPGVIDGLGLPTAPDGFPVTNYALEWAPGLHVSGPLAELELGPVAPNIIGARLAAQRIAAVV